MSAERILIDTSVWIEYFRIAVIAQENNCAVFTLDRHFKDIRQYAGIHLIDTEAAMRKK